MSLLSVPVKPVIIKYKKVAWRPIAPRHLSLYKSGMSVSESQMVAFQIYHDRSVAVYLLTEDFL